MVQARDILNIALGLIIVIALIIGGGSSIAFLSGHRQNFSDALLYDSVLLASCAISYFLNRPSSGKLQTSFYNIKWLLMFSVALIAAFEIFLYSFPVLRELIDYEFALIGKTFKIGLSIPIIVMLVGVSLAGLFIWKCPSCGKKLPFLGQEKGDGLSIKECPHCFVKLIET